ncbi:hypothetical protein DFJ77DRAFT_516476 [Powellomyces hirtus]|nr:hypothetical protein DFJ77DRAFT_516476 [Powellomyces hirtus]
MNPSAPSITTTALDTLAEWFPTRHRKDLEDVLFQCEGNIDTTVEILLATTEEPEHVAAPTSIAFVDLTGDGDIDFAQLDHSANGAEQSGPASHMEIPAVESLAELFPDARVEWLQGLIDEYPGENNILEVSELVLKIEGDYPKRGDDVDVKGKKRQWEADTSDGPSKRRERRDYTQIANHEMSYPYQACCGNQLRNDFPRVNANQINAALRTHNYQYLPTFFHFHRLMETPAEIPSKLVRDRPPIHSEAKDDEFNDERATVLRILEEARYTMECGCCCDELPLAEMTQCEDGHLFCRQCARRAAENVIGLRRTQIKCLSSDGCAYNFSRREIESFLSKTVFEGYLRLCQEVEIAQAGLAGLQPCPFCPFAADMSTGPEEDPLFFCQNTECKAVTCRKCQRRNHSPLTCAQVVENEAKGTHQHGVAEAMTEALLRACPRCARKFYKEEGCNKMICHCGAVICYVCRQIVPGYEHFTQDPNDASSCPLFDDTLKRNENDVKEAYQKAAQMPMSKGTL